MEPTGHEFVYLDKTVILDSSIIEKMLLKQNVMPAKGIHHINLPDGWLATAMRKVNSLPNLNEERGDQKFKPRQTLGRTLATRHTLDWVRKERAYADEKYPVSTIEQFGGALRDEDCDFVMQYLKRAQLLGIDSASGRQSLAKAFATLYDFVRSSVYLYGELPAPGLSSGNVEPWVDCPPVRVIEGE